MKSCHSILLIFIIFFFNNLIPAVIDVQYSGNAYFPDEILNGELSKINFGTVGSTEDKILKTVNTFLDFYSDKGFPLAVIKIDSINSRIDPPILFLNIESGDYVKYGIIDFSGNNVTKSSVLFKQCRLKINDKFDVRNINEAQNWLYKTRLFINKPEFDIIKQGGVYGIMFSLEEKKYIQIMLTGGYSTGEEKDNLSVLAEISADNIFGTMRKAELFWERNGSMNEKIKMRYREPFLLTMPLAAGLSFEQNYLKEIYLTREYKIEGIYDFDPRSSIRSGYSRQNIYPDSLYTGMENDVSVDKYSGGIRYSTLYDSQLIPRSTGYFIDSEISSVYVDLKDSVSKNGMEISLSSGVIFKYGKRIYLDIKTGYNQVFFDEEISEFNKISFGGAASFRGYREDFFISDIVLKQSADLYFVPESKDLAFNIFFENVFYNKRITSIEKINDLTSLWSTGGGIIFEFNSGDIEVTVGVPGKEGFGESMMHVRYSVRF